MIGLDTEQRWSVYCPALNTSHSTSIRLQAENSQREAMMEFVHLLVQAWNSHDIERITSFYAPDYRGVDVGLSIERLGREGLRQSIQEYLEAFPDFTLSAEEILVEGNRVAVHWTGTGTHNGHLMRIPPTSRKVVVQGVSIFTIADRKVLRDVHLWDVAGLLRSIHLLPDLPQSAFRQNPDNAT